MKVPALSMAFMVVTLIVSIGLPVALYLYMRKKYGAKLVPALIGAAAFVVFALVLEQIVHMLVLRPGADGSIALAQRPVMYMLYGGFMAGIFEETARFLSFRLIRKKIGGVRDAISYGIGHGGIEAIVLIGLVMVNNLVYSVMINSGAMDAVLGMLEGDALAQMQVAVSALGTTPSYHFLLAGLERICAITIHISLSVVVYCSVFGQRKIWLYPSAIVLHALINFPAALMQAGVLTNALAVEGFVLLMAALLAAAAVFVYKRWGRAQIEDLAIDPQMEGK